MSLRLLCAFSALWVITACQPAPATELPPNTIQLGHLQAINTQRIGSVNCKDDTRFEGNSGGIYGPVPSLRWSSRLYDAALAHAQDVVSHNLTATNPHLGSDGSQLADRALDAHYAFTNLGENIAWNLNPNSAQSAVGAWVDSSLGHCQALMDAAYVDVGIAEVNGLWVMMLGKPR